jgi:hypothetical protein
MSNNPSFSRDHSNSYRHLNPEEWKNIHSPYIEAGYKGDSFEITQLSFNDSEVIATCRMTQYYVSSTDDAGFHLSIFTAIAILGQPCIIHAHVINGIWRKDYEVLMSKLNIELNRPIRTPDAVSLRMWITEQQLKPSTSQKDLIRAAYTWAYDIEQGAFTGQLRAHFTFRKDAGSFPS